MRATLQHTQPSTAQCRVPCPGSSRSRILRSRVGCKVAEMSRAETATPARQDEVCALLASYMSFEGEFRPIDEWSRLNMAIQQGHPAPVGGPELAGKKLKAPAPAPAPAPSAPSPALMDELEYLEALLAQLQTANTLAAKVDMLSKNDRVRAYLDSYDNALSASCIIRLPLEERAVLLSVLAAGQSHALAQPASWRGNVGDAVSKLASSLLRIEHFYDSIGGLLGYQAKSLELIITGTSGLREELAARRAAAAGSVAVEAELEVRYHVPRALDLAGEAGREVGQRVAAAGLLAMPRMAEILPVGGAGDRLGLTCEVTGEALPAAMLPYCGRTMMEGLLRDLQAREYLLYRVTGQQVTTPVAIMTSDAKGNHRRISQLMEALGWCGRGREAFRLFRQPLVPVVSVSDGRWLLNDAMKLMAKPGGHGAIWKLMRDEGVFDWLKQQGRESALVRQISNPMAGVDTTLLALAGCGQQRSGAFGFMSCDRTIGAAEGCNVVQERRIQKGGQTTFEYGYTNIEYTEFDRLGISDQPVDGTSRRSVFPANTNVLYVKLDAAREVVEGAVATGNSEQLMPGLIFNLKKQVSYTDPLTGTSGKVLAGRMECTMQNIADHMTDRLDAPLSPAEISRRDLSTFLVYNMRRKVTSSAKKRREPGSTRISQTPDGSFFDLQRNAWHLLQQCGVSAPELGDVETYLERGPGFICLFHPALGPLWDVISQKLLGGSLADGSELVLEVAEARMANVHVDGSLLIQADSVMGQMEEPLTIVTPAGTQHAMPGVSHAPPAPATHIEMRPRTAASLDESYAGSLAGSMQSSIAEGEESGLRDGDTARLVYSERCGRVHMSNVTVRNAGIDWGAASNLYWKHQVERKQAVRVLLHGQAEFEAHNVVIAGDHTFEVPDGYRMVVKQAANGGIEVSCKPIPGRVPTWRWDYSMAADGSINLQFVGADAPAPLRVPGPIPAPAPAPTQSQLHPTALNNVQPILQQWRTLQQLRSAETALDFTI